MVHSPAPPPEGGRPHRFPSCGRKIFAAAASPARVHRSIGPVNTPAVKTSGYEFYFRDVDTLVKVENPDPDTVIVRATRNTFSERRKLHFIRRLAAEGFIPDGCQWYPLPAGMPRVHWVIDVSWRRHSRTAKTRARRFILGILGGGLVLWIALLSAFLFTHSP